MSEFFDALDKREAMDRLCKSIMPDDTADILEKGKKADIGEIRDWGGHKYQKTASGWVLVRGEGSTGKKTSTKGNEDIYTDPSGNTLSFTKDILPELSKIKPGVYSPESEVGRFLLDEIPDKFEKKMKDYFSEKKMTIHYNGEGAIEIKGKGEKKKKFKSLSKEQKMEEIDKVVKALEKYKKENKGDIDFLKVAHKDFAGAKEEPKNYSNEEKQRYYKLRDKVSDDLFDVVKNASPILYENDYMRSSARNLKRFLSGETKEDLISELNYL